MSECPSTHAKHTRDRTGAALQCPEACHIHARWSSENLPWARHTLTPALPQEKHPTHVQRNGKHNKAKPMSTNRLSAASAHVALRQVASRIWWGTETTMA